MSTFASMPQSSRLYRIALQGIVTIVTVAILGTSASAQWQPEKDSTGYTYYSQFDGQNVHRAYPAGGGYFYVYQYRGPYGVNNLYVFPGAGGDVTLYRTAGSLWALRGGTWALFSQQYAYQQLAGYEAFWQSQYKNLLANPSHMYYHAMHLASKELLDTVKRIAAVGPQ